MQRYDPDPAAKAAAATVLASKLGSDSGLKVYVGDESKLNVPTGKSNDIEVLPSSGLRNRKQLHTRSSSAGSSPLHLSDEETSHLTGSEGPQISENNQLVVNHHYPQGSTMNDGGWIARIAALLVGEDPTQSYALICGNCHMHNGESNTTIILGIFPPSCTINSHIICFIVFMQDLLGRKTSHILLTTVPTAMH